jgi:hypothetical protein
MSREDLARRAVSSLLAHDKASAALDGATHALEGEPKR